MHLMAGTIATMTTISFGVVISVLNFGANILDELEQEFLNPDLDGIVVHLAIISALTPDMDGPQMCVLM